MSNTLQAALELNYDCEIWEIKENMRDELSHEFTGKFQENMQKLLHGEKPEDEEAEPQEGNAELRERTLTRAPRRFWKKALIAAAVVILLMASTVAAVCALKPQIYYDIKEQLGSWGILFTDEQGDEIDSSPDAGAFEIVTLSVPEGFHLVSENKSKDNYQAVYENDAGKSIGFLQSLPDSAALNVDSEGEDIHEEFINGQHAIISHHGDYHTIVIENTRYVFVIDGNCDYERLHEIAESIGAQNEQ